MRTTNNYRPTGGCRQGVSACPVPDPWLAACAGLVPQGRSPALDLACGDGQNALWLASAGWDVTGVDVSPLAIQFAQEWAARSGLRADFQVADLESGAPFPGGAFHWGLIAVFHYLHRELLPLIQRALRPGGILVYKTHIAHSLREPGSRPRREAFLLRPGELLASFSLLQVLIYREWTVEGAAFAALVARRPGHSS